MDRKFDSRLLYAVLAALVIWLVALGWKTTHVLRNSIPQGIDASEHGGHIHFEADRSAVVFPTDCVTVSWQTAQIQAVFLGEDPQVGAGSTSFCGRDPRLHVVFQDGSDVTYDLPRTLVFDLETALLTLALGGLAAYVFCAYTLVTPVDQQEGLPKRKEIRPLTSYRGLAAALVFFYHQPIPVDGFFYALQIQGNVGVTLFFVLSGFLLAGRYWDDGASGRFRWRTYLVRRAARILPIYYTIVLIAFLSGDPFNFTNLTLTQGLSPNTWSSGLAPAWTLTVEESFYLLLPVILWLCWRTRHPWWTLCGIVALMYGVGCLMVRADVWTMSFMLSVTIFGRMIDFMIGVGCAFVYRRWQPGRGAWLLTLLCCVGFGLWIAIVSPVPGDIPFFYGNWVAALLAGGFILSLTVPAGWIVRIAGWSPFVTIGRISYALYLIQLIGPVEHIRATLKPIFGDVSSLVLYGLLSLICVALYQVIEKPAQRWIVERFAPAKPATSQREGQPSA